MFFIGIFGIEDRKKHIKYIQNIVCKACGSMSTYELIKVTTVFHIFFIPIAKWNKRYYVISRCCENLFEVSNEVGKKLEHGEDIILNNEYLNQITNNTKHNEKLVCNNCNSIVENTFLYCPHCGSKLK